MEENKEEDTLKKELWELGLSDRQIAIVFNVDMDIITDWRTNLGLDRNQVGVKNILNEKNSEKELKQALWELGLTDQQLADIFLVRRESIYLWRKKNGLKCNNKRKETHLEKNDLELRLKLFNENCSDEEIAIATGLQKGSITNWRWQNDLLKGKRNSEKIEELSEKELKFLEYLKSKYPERSDAFCIALARYVEPKVGVSPSAQQREFVRKIKIPGFKTIYYYDDGEYTNLNEALELFIRIHPYVEKNIPKIQSSMSRELYQAFLNYKYPDIQDTKINQDNKTRISVALDPESIEIIDRLRGHQSRSAYINELIHAYENGQ